MLKLGTKVYILDKKHIAQSIAYVVNWSYSLQTLYEPWVVVNRENNSYSLARELSDNTIDGCAWYEENQLTTDINEYLEMLMEEMITTITDLVNDD